MINNTKHNLLDTISVVYEKTEACKLTTNVFPKLKNELTILSNFLNLPMEEAFFLSIVFSLNYKNTNTIDFSDISKHMDSNPLFLLKYSKVFDNLCNKGYLIKEKTNYSFDVAYADDLYTVEKEVTEAILNNEPIKNLSEQKFSSIIDVLEQIYVLCESFSDKKLDSKTLHSKTEKILSANNNFEFIKSVERLNLNYEYKLMYFLLIWENLIGNSSIDIEGSIDKIISLPRLKVRLVQDFNNKEKNKLIVFDLIEIEEDDFINNSRMKLSEKSLALLEKEGLKLFKQHANEIDLMFLDIQINLQI